MSIPRPQRIAMASIVAGGVLALIALFLSGRGQPAAAPSVPSAAAAAASAGSSATSARAASAPEIREVRLDAAQARQAGITVQAVGAGQLQSVAQFPGEVRFNEDRTAHVVAGMAGVAQSVPANLGDTVRPGQVLAVLASSALSELRSELLTAQQRRDLAQAGYDREKKLWEDRISAQQDYLQAQATLQEAEIALRNARQKLLAVGAQDGTGALNRFELRAPFGGTVVEKHLTPGEAVKEESSLFTLADLRTVWVEFAVAPSDLAAVRVGQQAVVSSSAFDGQVSGRISYVGALLGEQTRTARARVTLDNPRGAWRPGLFVTVTVLGERQAAPVVVGADAVQTVDGQPVVFKAVAGGFAAIPVRIGRSDGRRVEVLQGLQPGDRVAAANTFVLKADLGKSSVEEE